MPLTRSDIHQFQPKLAVLGHIHKPVDTGKVHYIGSPSPLDITETGKRRFFLMNTQNGALDSIPIDTGPIFFDESLLILPVEDEEALIQTQVEAMIQKWGLSRDELNRVKCRIRIQGYSADRSRLQKIVSRQLSAIRLLDREPDYSEVYYNQNMEQAELAKRVSHTIKKIELPDKRHCPKHHDIILQALHVIYGE
jgi:hypothetical protein